MTSKHYIHASARGGLVAGLHWQYLPIRSRYGMRMRAREQQATHWVILPRNEGTLLGTVAMTTPVKGQKLASMALMLVRLLPKDCYAVFSLPDGQYWFIAIHQGQLSLLADVVGDETAIRSVAEQFIQATPPPEDGWDIIAPADFFPDVATRALALPDLVAQVSRLSAMLQTTDNTRNRNLTLAMLCALVVGYGLWHTLQTRAEEKRIAEAHARLLAAQNLHDVAHLAKPWAAKVSLPQLLTRCESAFRQAPISIAGWIFTATDCTAQGAMPLHYHRLPGAGTVSDFVDRLQLYYPGVKPAFNIPGNADDATVSLQLTLPAPAQAEDLPQGDTQLHNLTSYAQRLGAQLRLTPASAMTTVNNQAVDLPWRLYTFTFITPIPPDRLFDTDRFDSAGLRLSHITTALTGRRLVYTLEGTLYANR